MTPNPSVKVPNRNVAPRPQPQGEPVPTYCPSVPISVYRELAAELQSTQAMLESLNAQNQYLARQNQQLRAEIEKVVQSHSHLHQLAASFQPVGQMEMPPTYFEVNNQQRTQPQHIRSHSTPLVNTPTPTNFSPIPVPEPTILPDSEETLTEQEEKPYLKPDQPEPSSGVSGWFLIVAIFLIIATAFGTGFLIVRPLLNNNSR